ncbi:MAG: hypothetical protein KJO79_04675, partial [Verrucomicrobiae bacterium]|nr:hypothetical protein [Verrucomicrobiae bacterium]
MLKNIITSLLLISGATFAQNQPAPTAGVEASIGENGAGTVSLTAKGVLPKPKLFFTVDAVTQAQLTSTKITQTINLSLNILQGKPELLTLGLQGEGEITSVTGPGLVDWSVRTSADGKQRYLDIKPTQQPGPLKPRTLTMTVKCQHPVKSLPIQTQLVTLAPGEAAGFTQKLEINPGGLDARLLKIAGMQPLKKEWSFYSTGVNSIALQIYPSGAAPAAAELTNARLVGDIDEKLGSATFTLTATANITADEGGTIDVLSGRAAVSSIQENPGYRLKLVQRAKGASSYQLEFDRAGQFPVELQIIARVDEDATGWKTIDFTSPQGAVVPVELTGLVANVEFNQSQPLYPRVIPSGNGIATMGGFLPATGRCLLVWKQSRKAGEGKLAYTSRGLTDVTVGAGLMRQVSLIELKVLQGKINDVTLRMNGPGEVLDVSGTHVAGWTVTDGPGNVRNLKVSLSLPLENDGVLKIRSQQALGKFPVTAAPLRLTPVGVLRHSGYLRLSNAGAVRLETANVQGMMQLSPDQFPSKPIKSRQVFVYRYPSADYAWSVRADQILPEVSLNEVLIYEQTESDRIISATVELDIREAPLREWELRIPDGYAVARLAGAEVADYVVATTADKGLRDVKVLFKKAVSGRQLITIRLEKNAPAKAAVWQLPALEFPEVKSVRGDIGVSAAAGWRVVPGKVDGLTETPLSYFPIKNPDIQQTYRLRANAGDKPWMASMRIEAREQSVQADVFHLYSLKEGMAYGSVLLNYFVVGAPVTEWQLAIPESYGNVTIEGQNVRQWRRVDDEKVLVQLEQPVSGSATLLVTFENAMSARGGRLMLAEIRPLDVQGESGFIEVVSPVLVDHTIAKTTPGLLKISAQELPAEFRMLTTAPAIAAWQYAARPFELEVDVAWFEPGKTLDQVVDFAQLKSSVSRDGQVMTEATFYVRTRGRQALKMTLPYDAKLWDARADGKTITTRMDGDLYLLPLPAGDDPNKPVRVEVRYGGVANNGSDVKLGAPIMTAPMIIAGWKVSAEKGRLLMPVGDNSGVRTPPLTQSGFESLQGRGTSLLILAIMFVVGAWLVRRKNPAAWSRLLTIVWLAVLIVLSLTLAREILSERRVNQRYLEITAQVVSAESPVDITLKNMAPWRAMVSWLGVISGIAGTMALLASLVISKWRTVLVRTLAVAAIAAGILAQRGGGFVFCYILAAIAALLLLFALIKTFNHLGRWRSERSARLKKEREEAEEAVALGSIDGDEGLATEGVSKLLILGALAGSLFFGAANDSMAAANDTPAIDSITQSWNIKKDRLYATMDIKLQAKQGVSYHLLSQPAVLTSFNGDRLRVSKIKQNDKTVWMLAAERDGPLTATATYEM